MLFERARGNMTDASDRLTLTANLVSAFVGNNSLPSAEVPALIHSVHAALTKIAGGATIAHIAEPPPLMAAVSVRKSVTPDHIVCLEDGLRFKSLRRHLTALGMTPDQYRTKWNLPADYPMVSANYAAARSEMAKRIGLGRARGKRAGKSGRPGKAEA
jgi:MucR family transcriptional regulator, transcriptional regulator of exopolysaccharide biosynthesis